MDSNRKYLGMTVPQLGILAGLGGALCLILCVGGWLIFGGGLNTASPPPILTTVNPTATLILTPTVTPTPAPTLIPYEQLLPSGWKQNRTNLVEFWTPPEYKTAKLPEGIVLQAVNELILSHPASKSELYNKWILVSYEPLTTESLDSFLDLKLQSVDPAVRVVERRKVVLNGTEAVRMTFEARVDNIDVNELAFIILDGATVWYVEYVAQINDFYEQLPTFEQSILTFRLVK